MSNDDSFFSRWSRRKVRAKTGEPLPEPMVVPVATVAPSQAQAQASLTPKPPVPAAPPTAAETAAPESAAAAEPPAPTMDDVARLTPSSDFKPYVAHAVDPQVRNAAMKTLFSDPHFNVMDGLDIYIDDYSKPDPLPLELARKLTSAQFMRVFDAPEASPASPDASPDALSPPPPTTLTAAPSEAARTESTHTEPAAADAVRPDVPPTLEACAQPQPALETPPGPPTEPTA